MLDHVIASSYSARRLERNRRPADRADRRLPFWSFAAMIAELPVNLFTGC